MDIYFVSIRTALVYGPAELEELTAPEEGQASIRCRWEGKNVFDEWEGYAVVAPDRDQVWGAAHPQVADGQLSATFAFTPMALPPAEKKLFQRHKI
jgi:hypothetical protein